jgi:hypothetical protein
MIILIHSLRILFHILGGVCVLFILLLLFILVWQDVMPNDKVNKDNENEKDE